MILAAGILLIAAVFVVVAWPFFRKPSEGPYAPPSAGALNQWERQKIESYSAIKDAELDFQMGKMSNADFEFIRDKYAGRAIEAIAALEQAKGKVKSAHTTGALRFLFCPDCGQKLPGRARFCPSCGRSLRADDAA